MNWLTRFIVTILPIISCCGKKDKDQKQIFKYEISAKNPSVLARTMKFTGSKNLYLLTCESSVKITHYNNEKIDLLSHLENKPGKKIIVNGTEIEPTSDQMSWNLCSSDCLLAESTSVQVYTLKTEFLGETLDSEGNEVPTYTREVLTGNFLFEINLFEDAKCQKEIILNGTFSI